MEDLKQCFISSTDREYVEGKVNLFQQKIVVEKEVLSANLYITALGIYEAELNSEKVGDQIFAPGYTYYPRDLFYQSYTVTDQIHRGENTLKVYLGQGWYSGRFTHENKTQIYGDQSAVSWILEIEYVDHEIETFKSIQGVTELRSPYQYAGFYDGEIFDADVAEKDEVIGKASNFEGKVPDHLSETISKVILQETMPVKEIIRTEQATILDFGQNFAGIVEIDPNLLPENAIVKLRHGEILLDGATLYTDNLRAAKAEIIYQRGSASKLYRPRFTYMGFRYVELSGVDYVEGLIQAKALYNDMERTGKFSCDNKLVERLYENQLWGQKSNYVEVPTDCPQRDERMGYTGDGQAYAWTGSYNFDTERFFEKFLKDIRYSQMDNSEGYVAPTVPASGPAGVGFLSMLGWGNAVTIIPDMLYWQYGSLDHLIRQYDSIKKFVELEIRQMGENHLWLGANLGDWLMPGKDIQWMAMNNGPVSNSFIVNDLTILSKLAGKLRKPEDEKRYTEQLEKTRNAYIEKYISCDGVVEGDYQGAYIMALRYVLPKGDLYEKVMANFIKDVEKNGLNTGFFATEFLLPLLIESGRTKLAFDTLLDEACPGWMYQVLNGATTIWERWDALKEDGTVNDTKVGDAGNMVSFNHYAFGSVGEFYYQYILGIKPLLPGYKKIQLKPYTDPRLGKVTGSFAARTGTIKSAWEYQGNQITFSFETPVAAVIELPDGSKHEVEKGIHIYQIENN